MERREKQKPLVSIGIIFKNEIRCIERCLKSLEPLRKAAPCELVMADTGSTDGSREIAEKYADILIDFPWINDFAAARNAVMDRCSGKWYFSLDCDEWLDGNAEGMANFLRQEKIHDYIAISMRNYKTLDPSDRNSYTDFTAIRFLRMSTGLRFVGAVHERWLGPSDNRKQMVMIISMAFLHHDGYAAGVWSKEKTERNMVLLREKAKEEPNSLVLKAQLIESGGNSPEYLDYVRQGVQGVKDKLPAWETFGPPILRDAVSAAACWSLPELDEWLQMAEEWFPNSIYTKIDVEYIAAGINWNRGNYDACIHHAGIYFNGISEFESKSFNLVEALTNAVAMSSVYCQQNLRLFLIGAYARLHKEQEAFVELKRLDASVMGPDQAESLSRTYQHLQWSTNLDTAEMLQKNWEQLCRPEPTEAQAQKRKERFLRNAAEVFKPSFIQSEPQKEGFLRHSYSAYAALEGQCTLGIASKIMTLNDAGSLDAQLAKVEDWNELPICALEHSILCGAQFPPPEKMLPIELMDRLAVRLAADGCEFDRLTAQIDVFGLTDLQSLNWARAIILAAIRVQDWKEAEKGLRLANQFVQIEKQYIPRCYAPEMLTEQAVYVLPLMHRFGWYCVRAYGELEAGDPVKYVRLLRAGLTVCPEMKAMTEFLLDHTPEIQAPAPSEELQALADQIRAVLEKFPSNDPAVVALKESEAYQKVAYLIEGLEVPIVGGLKQ